ncbi:hypothetical protein G7054_g9942 [Neopestalotiopsis clavispora]|nr:hypothetical protein G7054_g9942 [Neopestalotiopsis clavispora]
MDEDAIRLNTLNANPLTPAKVDAADASPESGCRDVGNDTETTEQEFSLPPTDGGKDAWLFLAACWSVEALIWGFGFSFGIFQDYYTSHEPFEGAGNVAAIGTSALGTMYMGTPVVIALCRLYPRYARWATQAGLFVASLTIALSSFCTTVPQLIAVQGVLFGVGGCVAYCPCVLYIEEWFVRRKGMAYGIMWSAAGFGGVVLPLVLEALLARFGFAGAMRIWSGILFTASFPLAFFVKPRLPAAAAARSRPFDVSGVLTRAFALHQLGNIVQASGFFLPGIYLPSYARSSFGASSFMSALTVLLVNVAATMGSITMGTLTDKVHVTTCIAISTAGTAIGVFLIWGLSSSLPILFLFCIVYGFFAGGWTSIWPGIMRDVARQGEAAGRYVDPTMVFGWLCVGRGIGNIVSGPLSDSLLASSKAWVGQATAGFGSGYGSLIVYTGVASLIGGSSFVWKCIGVIA